MLQLVLYIPMLKLLLKRQGRSFFALLVHCIWVFLQNYEERYIMIIRAVVMAPVCHLKCQCSIDVAENKVDIVSTHSNRKHNSLRNNYKNKSILIQVQIRILYEEFPKLEFDYKEKSKTKWREKQYYPMK